MTEEVYAVPRVVTDVSDCYFYHTIDLPGYGLMRGEWDLRAGVRDYLGRFDFRGKRVLEIGTANGFLCFHMEQQGAQVVGVDLSERDDWDVVPYAAYDYTEFLRNRKAHMRKINNAWWLSHRVFKSAARVVYGSVYEIPSAIGAVDVATFGSVLLHLRDPFLALHKALRLTRGTAIVTDKMPTAPAPRRGLRRLLAPRLAAPPDIAFLPDARASEPKETWWVLSPAMIQRFLAVLGFEDSTITYHKQPWGSGLPVDLYTVVAHRTKGAPVV